MICTAPVVMSHSSDDLGGLGAGGEARKLRSLSANLSHALVHGDELCGYWL